MCDDTCRMAIDEGKQARMWKPKYMIYFKLPYWSPFCSEWRGSRRMESKSFLFYLFVKSFIQRNLPLEIFYVCPKDRKVKNDAAAQKAKMKRYHHLTPPFFPLWGLMISREQVAGAHIWYPRGRSLYRNQAQENVCLQTSPWTKSIWTVQFIFSPPAGVH